MTNSPPRRPDVEQAPRGGPAPASEKGRRNHARRCPEVPCTGDAPDSRLAGLVLAASKGSRLDLDEQYTLTAFVVHRRPSEDGAPIVVELLDHGPCAGSARWQAVAHDELSGAATQLGQGESVERALASLDWRSLE